jgi:hypothetical protein
MNIVYTAHLEFRLKVRKIPASLPKKVFKESKDHYYDTSTGHCVAVGRLEFNGKIRELAVTYDKKFDIIEVVTIHPLKMYQKMARIKSGRWQKL